MTLRPAPIGFGIVFKRTDVTDKDNIIPVSENTVVDTRMCTCVGNKDGVTVGTIEHLMAALFMLGIDSAVVEIDGKETPILDGSAAQFIEMFQSVGVTDGKLKRIIVKQEVVVFAKDVLKDLPKFIRFKIWLMNKLSGRKSDGFVKLSPNDGKSLDISATLVYPEKIIGTQSYTYSFDETKKSVNSFIENVARARTFGKYSEWEYLKKHGMGRGANEGNVIALNDAGDGTLNKLIWPDEFVRHKIIDAIGDMFTSSGMICGKLESYKGSHALNNLILKKLFSNTENYDIIDAE
jgi:UDP-3-O-[3-hydroxymyristoyl] N-acetylglucosamine deacetylase